MIVIDASVWVSYLIPQDVNHGVTVSWLDRYLDAEQVLIAPTVVLPEVSGAIARRVSTTDGHRARTLLQQIDLLRFVAVDDTLADQAAQLACDLHLKGADAVYVAVADALGLALISWDGEHVTRAAQRIRVYSPDTAP